MSELLLDFLRDHGTTIRALVALTLAATVCAVVGCFIVLRRMAFLADALAHSMLAGVVVGYLLMKLAFGVEASSPGMLVGALLAGLATVGLIGFVTRVSRIKSDTATGIMYTGIFAFGGFLATYKPLSQHVQVDLYHFVVGSVLSVSDSDLRTLTVVTILVLGSITLFYRHLKLVAFDAVMAAALGIPVLAVDYLLTGCASLVVVWGVGIVGVVLVVALIVTPAATAYLLHDRLERMIVTAVVAGIASGWIGYALATWTRTAPGPAIVVVGTLQFLIVLVVSPRYGLIADRIRRSTRVSQVLLEDVLLHLLKSGRERMTAGDLGREFVGRAAVARRALLALEGAGRLERAERNAWRLTESGRAEAHRLVRAHRLWETYLERVGMPADSLHATAQRLEHVNDPAAVDYLDDKLGHPLLDPHGAEIPIVPGSHQVGRRMPASELRRGFVARVVGWSGEASGEPLPIGSEIRAGRRADDGRAWILHSSDGRRVSCDHETADRIEVEILRDEND